MQYRLLIALMLLLAACGDSGPESVSYTGAWRLTSVNTQPLPSSANTIEGRLWVAGVLQLDQQTGTYDWCWEGTSTFNRTSASDYVVLAPSAGTGLR